MSSTCIYKEFVAKISSDLHGGQEDQFLLVTLVGDSNVYTHSGKRSRNWAAQTLGTSQMIIADAICCADGFERGGLYFGNFGSSGSLLPEQYIAKARRMIKNARPVGADGWVNSVCITPRKAGMDLATAFKAAIETSKQAYDAKSRSSCYDFICVRGPTD